MVASMSTVTGPLPVPGAASLASRQARCRAAARAARIAFCAPGASPASRAFSRDITGSDATGPNRSGSARITPASARQSPPNATAMARSSTVLPGSCTARAGRHRASPADRPAPRPVIRAVSVSSSAPAWDTIPVPSPDAVIFGRRTVFCICKVPSARTGYDSRQALSSKVKGTFCVNDAAQRPARLERALAGDPEAFRREHVSMAVELDAQVSDARDFAHVAAGWLTQVREILLPNLDQGLKAGGVLFPRRRDDEFYRVRGEPRAVWAELWVRRKPSVLGGTTALFSQRAWDRLLSGLEAAYPFHIDVTIKPLDEDGQPPPWGDGAAIAVHRLDNQPEWVNFSAACSRLAVPGIDRADARQRWADFTHEWAGTVHASYGEVSGVIGDGSREGLVHVDFWQVVPRSPSLLRGYSWATVCPAEVVAKAGGVEALRASGAFVRVEELPGGSVWLQATDDPFQFDPDASRRVFDALRFELYPDEIDERESRFVRYLAPPPVHG
jgi:hypothetical protein